jgi:cytochrome c-type biogenesis protein CcmH
VKRLWLAVAVCFGALALAAEPGLAATPKTTVNDVEDEVMCPICGTLLELADSPQAQREKAYVARLVAEGKTKTEIEDALVAQYGSSVLATPEASGFDLSAYLVPILALLVAVVVLAFSVGRWRRGGGGSQPDGAAASRPQGADAERLDAELCRYDL